MITPWKRLVENAMLMRLRTNRRNRVERERERREELRAWSELTQNERLTRYCERREELRRKLDYALGRVIDIRARLEDVERHVVATQNELMARERDISPKEVGPNGEMSELSSGETLGDA